MHITTGFGRSLRPTFSYTCSKSPVYSGQFSPVPWMVAIHRLYCTCIPSCNMLNFCVRGVYKILKICPNCKFTVVHACTFYNKITSHFQAVRQRETRKKRSWSEQFAWKYWKSCLLKCNATGSCNIVCKRFINVLILSVKRTFCFN